MTRMTSSGFKTHQDLNPEPLTHPKSPSSSPPSTTTNPMPLPILLTTTRPHLLTYSPSPTTTLHTVTTLPLQRTLPSTLLSHLLLLLRLTLGLTTFFILSTKYFHYTPTPLKVSWSTIIEETPWSQLLPMAGMVLFLVFRRYYSGKIPFLSPLSHPLQTPKTPNSQLTPPRLQTEESLLTLRSLGIQTRTLSSSYLLPSTTRFIPTSQIRDIFIHEAFRGFEVRYYLAVVVEGEGGVVVVFPVCCLGC